MRLVILCLIIFNFSAQAQIKVEITKLVHNKCFGDKNGFCEVEASGGSGKYIYIFGFADGYSGWVLLNNDSVAQNLACGKYYFEVSDALNPVLKIKVEFEILAESNKNYKFYYHTYCSTDENFPRSKYSLAFDSIVGAQLPYKLMCHDFENKKDVDTTLIAYKSSIYPGAELPTYISSLSNGRPFIGYKLDDGKGCPAFFRYRLPEDKVNLEIKDIKPKDTHISIYKGTPPFSTKLEFNLNLPFDSISAITFKDYDHNQKKVVDTRICKTCNSFGISTEGWHDFNISVKSNQGCIVGVNFLLQPYDTIKTEPTKEFGFDIYLPNIFSPNDDGVNDYLNLFGADGIDKVLNMQVYDKWGNLIFEEKDMLPNDSAYGWNGTYKSSPANQGSYTIIYLVSFKDGRTKTVKNTVQLIR